MFSLREYDEGRLCGCGHLEAWEGELWTLCERCGDTDVIRIQRAEPEPDPPETDA